MKSFPVAASIFVCLSFTACTSPLPVFESEKWEHKGVTYRTSAEYLEAVERDRFATTYPPQATLADFRRFDDMRLGLYYFHYVNDPQGELPELSPETLDALNEAMAERGVNDRWLAKIEQHNIEVGMPLVALYASWGPPWDGYRSTTHQGETRIQHIYMDEHSRRTYVYTTGGHVTSWNN